MDDDRLVLRFAAPLKAGDQTWSEIELVEPTVGQVLTAQRAGSRTTFLLALISEITKVPTTALRSMAASKAYAANRFFLRFSDPDLDAGDDEQEWQLALKRSLRTGDREFTELLLVEPTVGQLTNATDEAENDPTEAGGNNGLVALVSAIAKVPQGTLREMLWSDLRKADKFLERFGLDKPLRAPLLMRSRSAEGLRRGA